MPSPFPGMDPYLEGELWTSVLHSLATVVTFQLAPKLEPRYVAFPKRYTLKGFVEPGEIAIADRICPDVGISKASTASLPLAIRKNGATAVMNAVPMRMPKPYPVAQFRILIRDVRRRKLVTVIEFLSPVNKRGDGRKQYLRKRNRVINSGTHLMEIDLLRKGKRMPMEEDYPPGDYCVVVSRANKRPDAEVWGVKLEEPLPVVPVPLMLKDADVLLDLQQAVTDLYDMGRFKYAIDYRKPPDVPLTRAENAWAVRLLKSKGLR